MTEINSKNQLVVLDTFEAPPTADSSDAESANIKTAESAGKVVRPDPAIVPPLRELVTPEQHDALHQLALGYKRTLVLDPEQQVELGK